MKTISAAEANRYFSRILRDVAAGDTIVVTSRGKPVARIEPICEQDAKAAAREAAMKDLIEHLRTVQPMNIPITWTRDDIYDDDF